MIDTCISSLLRHLSGRLEALRIRTMPTVAMQRILVQHDLRLLNLILLHRSDNFLLRF